jgi:hypothetical protein
LRPEYVLKVNCAIDVYPYLLKLIFSGQWDHSGSVNLVETQTVEKLILCVPLSLSTTWGLSYSRTLKSNHPASF